MTARSAIAKIARAAEATRAVDAHADAVRDDLISAFNGPVANGYGVYGDPGWQRRVLREERDNLTAALKMMDATDWPTDADYDAAENAEPRPTGGRYMDDPGRGGAS